MTSLFLFSLVPAVMSSHKLFNCLPLIISQVETQVPAPVNMKQIMVGLGLSLNVLSFKPA